MSHSRRRSIRVSIAVLVAMVISLATAYGPASPASAAVPTPFFSLDMNFSDGTEPGYAIRDGGPVPPSGSHGPFFELYGWVSDTVRIQSFSGFQGTITLIVSNLPTGVTVEQMPASVTLAKGKSNTFALRVRVAATVPLNSVFSGIRITGRSGSLTVIDTMTAPITVVDPLPCSTYNPYIC